MRHLICAALLTAVLGFGSIIQAAELTASETGKLLSLAASVTNGTSKELTTEIGGKSVTLTVSRDAVGNLIARPTPTSPNGNQGISQINIQCAFGDKGQWVPKSLLVIGTDLAITSYSMTVNKDNSISQLIQSGTFAPSSGGGGGGNSVTGGLGRLASDQTQTFTKVEDWLNITTIGFNSAQLQLPAGAGTGEVSGSKP